MGLTGYCFKYIDRPFCLRTNDTVFNPSLIHNSVSVVLAVIFLSFHTGLNYVTLKSAEVTTPFSDRKIDTNGQHTNEERTGDLIT